MFGWVRYVYATYLVVVDPYVIFSVDSYIFSCTCFQLALGCEVWLMLSVDYITCLQQFNPEFEYNVPSLLYCLSRSTFWHRWPLSFSVFLASASCCISSRLFLPILLLRVFSFFNSNKVPYESHCSASATTNFPREMRH